MKILELFAGVGGFSLALESIGLPPATWFCEFDPFARSVLARHWPGVPCFPDVHDVGDVGADAIVGGPPCQAISVAGKQLGPDDPRFLWPATMRVVRANRPRWCFFENPGALLSHDDGRTFLVHVARPLAEMGYLVRWDHCSASAVGAPHRRDRVWISAVMGGAAPGPADVVAVPLFGASPEMPAGWPRAGWYDGRRWGTERARWPVARDAVLDPNQNGAAWPTPDANAINDGNDPARWQARRQECRDKFTNGNGFGTPLAMAAKLAVWPTPKTTDYRAGNVSDATLDKNSRPLTEIVWSEAGRGDGKLSADFAEWLMGLPIGWTRVDGPSLVDADVRAVYVVREATHAATHKADSGSVLPNLRRENGAQEVQRSAGEPNRVLSAQDLRRPLYGDWHVEGQPDQGCLRETSQDVPKDRVRAMRGDGGSPRSPQGSESHKQRPVQPGNAVSSVPLATSLGDGLHAPQPATPAVRTLWETSEGTRLLHEALPAVEEVRRPTPDPEGGRQGGPYPQSGPRRVTLPDWSGDLVYYGGRPAPRGMPLLVPHYKGRRERLRCVGNGLCPRACAAAAAALLNSVLT